MRVVVKVGGSLMKGGVPTNLVEDVASLSANHQVVLVHGGGEVVTDYATRLGKEQRFVTSPGGIRSRYTDRETAEIYQMVMTGLLAKRLVLALDRAGVKAISVSGTDGRLIQAKRKAKLVVMDERGRRMATEGGYTGKVVGINAALLHDLLKSGYVPVVSPVAISEEGDPLNIDGDKAASSVAAGISADLVVFLTDVEGLSLDGVLVAHLTPAEASERLPKIGFGMQKKVMAGVDAVENGVKEAIISSGQRRTPLTQAMSHTSCTVISQ